MYNFLLQAHSGWRYLVLLALLVVLVKFLVGWLNGQKWSALDQRIGTFTVIGIDIQLLLGLVLWGWGASLDLLEANIARTIEHPITMLIAIVMMHVGWNLTKKAQEAKRFRNGALTFVVTSLLVVAGLTRIGGIL